MGLKCVGFSLTLSRINVVINEELESASKAGPLSSTDKSIDWAVSETAEKGTTPSLSSTSMRWHAARDIDTDVTARDALCQADIQYVRRVACFADCWKAALFNYQSTVVLRNDMAYAARPIIAHTECTGFSSEMHIVSFSSIV